MRRVRLSPHRLTLPTLRARLSPRKLRRIALVVLRAFPWNHTLLRMKALLNIRAKHFSHIRCIGSVKRVNTHNGGILMKKGPAAKSGSRSKRRNKQPTPLTRG